MTLELLISMSSSAGLTDFLTFVFLVIGWKTLCAILDELKDRPVKRTSEGDVSALLAKRVRGVDLDGR